MKGTKLLKLAALCLCVAMLLGNATVLAFADGTSGTKSSSSSGSLESIKELLNAISYEEYAAKHADVPRATDTVEVPMHDCVTEGDGFKWVEVDNQEGLYTPQDGSVTWTVNVPKAGKYAIKLEYYPDANRTTSIERVLMINGQVLL